MILLSVSSDAAWHYFLCSTCFCGFPWYVEVGFDSLILEDQPE